MTILRIGFDASSLAMTKSATGLSRYLACLLTHLVDLVDAEDLQLHLYFAQPIPPEKYAPGTPLSKLRPGKRIRWRIAPTARGWQRIGMGIMMQLDRLHVFHFPAPIMAGYCPVASVVTFHDLAALSIDKAQTTRESRYLPAAVSAGQRATAVIAVSDSARDEVIRHLGRSDTVLILEGVDTRQFRPMPPDTVQEIRQRYGLDHYILCVGTLQARKNHLRLIEAYEQIQGQIPHDLVIAGGDGSGAADIRARLQTQPNPRVHLLGYVEENLLPAFYTGADALTLPSLWEGFGLPLVEAMACGTPVLTSNISSLAEVAGNAALLVNPENTAEIADQLFRLLTNSDLRQRLIHAGYERAKVLSWGKAARQTLDVYRKVAPKA